MGVKVAQKQASFREGKVLQETFDRILTLSANLLIVDVNYCKGVEILSSDFKGKNVRVFYEVLPHIDSQTSVKSRDKDCYSRSSILYFSWKYGDEGRVPDRGISRTNPWLLEEKNVRRFDSSFQNAVHDEIGRASCR